MRMLKKGLAVEQEGRLQSTSEGKDALNDLERESNDLTKPQSSSQLEPDDFTRIQPP